MSLLTSNRCSFAPALLLWIAWLWLAAIVPAQAQDRERPVIGLVLSGGGAKGIAHIGVLEVLEAHNVPVDIIVGTSMGAIVGGLYASGYNAAELRERLTAMRWDDVLLDSGERRYHAFRRKREDRDFFLPFSIGIGAGGIQLPQGVVQGQRIMQALSSLALRAEMVDHFDELPIPYRAVATDLETGEAVLLDRGSLAMAMRASMSIPGFVAPVSYDGRVLVDGSLVNNVPVDIARQLGAEILIVVDVGTAPRQEKEIKSIFRVMDQSINLMIRRQMTQNLESLSDSDILISPLLADVTPADFNMAVEIVDRGNAAAREHTEALTNLAISDPHYHDWRLRVSRAEPPAPVINALRVENHSRLSEQFIRSRVRHEEGNPLDHKALRQDIDRLYGLGYFEQIGHHLEPHPDGGNTLVLTTKEKRWGPNFLRFGLFLEDDFDGSSNYTAAVSYYRPMLNQLGAEWRADVQLGDLPRFYTELWQPFTDTTLWFVAPFMNIQREELPLIEDGRTTAIFRVSTGDAGVDLGRELSTWGEWRVGVSRGAGEVSGRAGATSDVTQRFQTAVISTQLSWDTLDNRGFPRGGNSGQLQYQRSESSLGASEDFQRASLSMLSAWSRGPHTLLWLGSGGTLVDGEATPHAQFRLGGLFNLSGYRQNELLGDHFAHAGLVYYRRLGEQQRLLGLPAYAGLSLEKGNIWEQRSAISFRSARTAGSVLLGVETPIGPLYLAAGVAENSKRSLYFYLGQTF